MSGEAGELGFRRVIRNLQGNLTLKANPHHALGETPELGRVLWMLQGKGGSSAELLTVRPVTRGSVTQAPPVPPALGLCLYRSLTWPCGPKGGQ